MKKILLIMLCMILLVGTISANELLTIDNIKQYDESTKTITIVNTFGLGRDIATIQLNTPLNFEVGAGYRKVAEFTIDSFDDTYSEPFDKMDFYDLNNNEKKFEREFDYKYKTTELVDVNDYKESCNTWGNGTKYCSQVISGTHQELQEVWKDLDTSVLTKGKVTIGIFTIVEIGDYVDWIPTFFGKEIDEWASWTADLNTGLIHYWALNESSGNQLDDLGTLDFTNNGGLANQAGKLGTSYFFNDTTETDANTGNSGLTGDIALSFSIWFKKDSNTGAQQNIFDMGVAVGGTRYQAGMTGANTLSVDVSGTFALDFGIVDDANWHHLVVSYLGNGTGCGSLDGAAVICDNGNLNLGDGPVYLARQINVDNAGIDGFIDDFAMWNRTLTFAELTQLYNGGSGIAHANVFPPTISLNTPIDNANFTTTNINFGGVVLSNTINLVTNVSLIIDDEYIETNSSGINNSNYTFTFTNALTKRDYVWTYEACNNESLCTNATTRAFTIDYVVEEGIFYNSTSYETKEETFIINITTNGTYTTSAVFYYDGVSQGTSTKTGTNTNANFSNTIQIPTSTGEKEFYWNITVGSKIEESTKTNQTVNETIWAYCNATYITSFLNVSFKDESDDSMINATIPTSNFIYYLGDGTVTKTYTYINTTLNFYYQFCATPNLTIHADPYIQYKQGTDYPQRIYDTEVLDYTNTTTDLTLYLLGTADGIYVTFQVINTANLVLSGVEVSAVREISGTDVQVGIGTTGADGGVTLWLNPDFSHDFTFTKSGFTTLETSFPPTQSAYTITLGGGVTPTDSYFRGIISSILPTDVSLVNDTDYTFGFNLTSSFWSLEEYGFDLRLVNGTIITGGSTSTSGTPLTLSFNTLNQTKIYLDYYWLINSTYTNGTSLWLVYNILNTQWSISTFFTDLDTYLDSGFFGIDNFGRYLIIFIFIFFTIGIMSYKFGFTSPLNISVMTFLIVFFFDVVVGIIPPLSLFSGTEVNYLLTFLTGLIATIVILNEVRK